jgi:hypothetical protein
LKWPRYYGIAIFHFKSKHFEFSALPFLLPKYIYSHILFANFAKNLKSFGDTLQKFESFGALCSHSQSFGELCRPLQSVMGFAVLRFAVPFVSFEWHRLLSEMRWGIEDLGVWFIGEKRNGKFFVEI